MLPTTPGAQVAMLQQAAELLRAPERCLAERGHVPEEAVDAMKILIGLAPNTSILRADIMSRSLVLDCLHRMKASLPYFVAGSEKFGDNFSLWLINQDRDRQAEFMDFAAARLEDEVHYRNRRQRLQLVQNR